MPPSPEHESASDTRPAMSEAEVAECDALCGRIAAALICVGAAVHAHVRMEKEDQTEGAPPPLISRHEIFKLLGCVMEGIASDRDRLATLFGAK